MKKRLISIVLCVMILLSTFSCLIAVASTTANAATQNQLNMVARANYMYNATWKCQQNVYGWCYQTLFYAGNTYRVPYVQAINSGVYVGFGGYGSDGYQALKDSNVAEYQKYANTAGSIFYTQRSTYSSYSSTYYGSDCSAYVSWAWGTSRRTTYSVLLLNNLTRHGYASTSANVQNLQLGDALNSNSIGHIVLVTGITKNSAGTITGIEITEQTPPQLKRTQHTVTSLINSYYQYEIIRYSGSVPTAPDGSTVTPSSTATTSNTQKYYPACSSSCTTLYEGFAEVGITQNKETQLAIAKFNGMTDFSYTAEENAQLLALLKEGKLLNPYYDENATTAPTTSSVDTGFTTEYFPACASTCSTLYEGFKDVGIAQTKEMQAAIAKANGMENYSYSADENTQMLNLLKAGKLKNPSYVAPTTATTAKPTEATEKPTEATTAEPTTKPTDAPETSTATETDTQNNTETVSQAPTSQPASETDVNQKTYQLVGYINGEYVGIGSDADGEGYVFGENKKVTVVISENSQVQVKCGDTLYAFTTICDATVGELENTSTGANERMVVAPGVVTFTLYENANDTLVLSYSVENPTESTEATETTEATEATTQKPTVKPATSAGPGQSAEAVEQLIVNQKNDNDPKGSVFALLQAKVKKVAKTSITIKWNKVSGAKKYVVYGNQCGKTNKFKKLKTTTGTSFTHKKLKKATYYKYLIVAVNGKGKTVTTSKGLHISTLGNNKRSNPIGVSTVAKNNKVNLKKGKTFNLKAKSLAKKGTKVSIHRVIKYESTNTKGATVNAKGKITAKKKGVCYVYAYAQNGIAKKIKVTVK